MVGSDIGDSTSLGAWAGDDLASTARANAGIGADADLPADVRFQRGIAQLIRLRLAEMRGDGEQNRPAVFLLEPTGRAHKPDAKPKRVPMLNNGLTPVCGRLWYVCEVAASGKFVELDDLDDDDALFNFVTDVLGLGGVPAIIFDPRTKVPSLRYYPKGLGDPDVVEAIAVGLNAISLDCIFDAIKNIYQKCLITPQVQETLGRLWDDAQKWWPVRDAERVIQMHLRHGLSGAFPTCIIRREQTDVPGRLDLEIEERDALDRNSFTRHAILELKVLRSFHSDGGTESAKEVRDCVKSGVQQAASYRKARGARAAGLCCFDMREEPTGEQCFEHVRNLANKLEVALRVWFLFATSERYREFFTMQN